MLLASGNLDEIALQLDHRARCMISADQAQPPALSSINTVPRT